MSSNWKDGEGFKLIKQWGKQGIQEQLEGAVRNKYVYEKLSIALAKAGVKNNEEQSRSTVKKLRQNYKIKDRCILTGWGRTMWKFCDSLNKTLGTRSSTCPGVIVDT